MRTQIYLIAGLILLSLFILTIEQCNRIKHYKSDIERHKNNYNALTTIINGMDSSYSVQINLDREQFDQEYDQLIDSLNKKMNLKIKSSRVDRLSNIKIKRIHDTLIVWRDSILPGDTIIKGKSIQFEDKCFNFSVYSPSDTNIAMVRTDLNIDTYIIIHKGKRSKQFKIASLPIFRYGKRAIETTATTNCTGAKLKIIDIQIID